ncbi:hypothetical protein ATY81_08575 [Rhizobium sp. R72]|uniref:O-antigen polymerase n=1 Tax=unclassified Rhizobium TaxID=2613769 RepID=UPI000B7521E0|nr:hypothetical protein ATY81_08575 [Rhizobium sp. R72]OWV97807.1 hypothetical protein ATY80_08575 [Rhizobium sp. R711]
MNWWLTYILVVVVFSLLGVGMVRRVNLYQFPFLTGVITFAFLLPQVPALADDRFLPENAFAKAIGFTILCLLMTWLGYISRVKPVSIFRHDFSEKRLLIVAFVLSLLGAYFYYQLSRLPADSLVGVEMTGVSVMYVFFSRLLCYGLAIAVLCFARRMSFAALIIIALDLVFYLDRILVTGKRAEAVELCFIFVLAFWFYRGWMLPRVLTLAVLLLGTVGMFSMGDYRNITRANGAPVWDDVERIDVVGNITQVLRDGGPEMRNAVLLINNTDTTLDFDYGKFHWNRLIFSYVPAQLLGSRFKSALMLQMPVPPRDYNPLTGTTETGMADAFQSFWYFGALKFFLLSYLMHRIWVSANAGEASAQVVYMLSIVPAMHAVSHTTDWVLMVWVHMLIFLVPSLAFARTTPQTKARRDNGKSNIPFVSKETAYYEP